MWRDTHRQPPQPCIQGFSNTQMAHVSPRPTRGEILYFGPPIHTPNILPHQHFQATLATLTNTRDKTIPHIIEAPLNVAHITLGFDINLWNPKPQKIKRIPNIDPVNPNPEQRTLGMAAPSEPQCRRPQAIFKD